MSLHGKCAPAVMRSVEPGKAAGDNHCEANDDGEDSTNCTIRSGLTFLGVPHLSSSNNLEVSPPKGTLFIIFIYIYICIHIIYGTQMYTVYIHSTQYVYICTYMLCISIYIYIYIYTYILDSCDSCM